MAELPDLPLSVKDILTSCQTMTPKEFGVHCRLLFHSWAEAGHLPNDERKLRILSGLTGDKYAKNTLDEVLLRWTCEEKTISHGRIKKSWDIVRKTHESYQIRGSKGGTAKSSSAKSTNKARLPTKKDGKPRKTVARKPTSDDVEAIGNAYRTIRPDGIASGMANVEKWLREGRKKSELLQAIEHYRPVAETREVNYRKKLGNFFGRTEPEFLDWIDMPEKPAVVSEKNKEIMGFDSKKFAGKE